MIRNIVYSRGGTSTQHSELHFDLNEETGEISTIFSWEWPVEPITGRRTLSNAVTMQVKCEDEIWTHIAGIKCGGQELC